MEGFRDCPAATCGMRCAVHVFVPVRLLADVTQIATKVGAGDQPECSPVVLEGTPRPSFVMRWFGALGRTPGVGYVPQESTGGPSAMREDRRSRCGPGCTLLASLAHRPALLVCMSFDTSSNHHLVRRGRRKQRLPSTG